MLFQKLFALNTAILFANAASASTVVKIGDVAYFVPEKVELDFNFGVKDPLPVTVVTSVDVNITASWLNETIANFLAADDVYSEGFFSALYVQGPLGVQVEGDLATLANVPNFSKVFMAGGSCRSTIPDGPYFATCSGLHRAWRLYDDTTNSFVLPVIASADDPSTYEPLAANSGNPMGFHSIAVPSRLFYKPTTEQPLAGYRIGVKDEYDLKGVLTTMGSRSYAMTYPPANASTALIQNLLEQGAIIVGKTKLSAFAQAYFTAAQWVDYSLPVNVRADTYQIPGASSTGSGSSMIAYDWLDNTVGEDTGGSMRYPGALNGLFSIRSSINSTSRAGVEFGPFGTAGHFARDVDSFNSFGAAMYSTAGFKNYTTFPKKIIYPTEYWTSVVENYTVPCEEYVQKLEAFLGVNRTVVDSNELWLETGGHGNISIGVYFENTFSKVIAPSTYDGTAKLQADYEAKFNGDLPYMTENGPSVVAAEVFNQSEIDAGNVEREEFITWYTKNFLTPDENTCSEAIVVFPFNGNGGVPWYRDSLSTDSANGIAPSSIDYVSWNVISPYNGSPEIVVPVGTVGYKSRVTLADEELPVALEIQGAYGCDFMLMNLVRDMAYTLDLPKGVKTGQTLF